MDNDDLAQYLNALQREECYRVDAVLKESPFEVTQKVSFIGANGSESGPYIRKFIKRGAGLGGAYERLYKAQQEGRRFRYLPHVLECYLHDDSLAVVMEYVQGETLQDLVYRVDPSTDLVADVFPLLCDAVCELHEDFDPPIIHRDLKPSNVIVSDFGLTIIDFGIAREFKEGAEADTVHYGTRAFAPPEQFGFGQTTVRSDVYALGMMLYYCLTETIPDMAGQADWLDDPRITPRMRGVISKAVAFDPLQRFASVRALKNACRSALEEPDGQALGAPSQAHGVPSQTLGAPSQAHGAPSADQMRQAQAERLAQVDDSAMPSSVSASAGGWVQAEPQIAFQDQGQAHYQSQGQAHYQSQGQNQGEGWNQGESQPFAQTVQEGHPEPSFLDAAFRWRGRGSRSSLSVRNASIAVLFIGFFVMSIGSLSSPPPAAVGYPLWYRALVSVFLAPAVFAIVGFALWDKRGLRARYPVLEKLRPWHYVAAVIAAFLVVFVLIAVISFALRAA